MCKYTFGAYTNIGGTTSLVFHSTDVQPLRPKLAESSSTKLAFGLCTLIIYILQKIKSESSNRPAGTLQQNVRHGDQRFKKRHLEWFGLLSFLD